MDDLRGKHDALRRLGDIFLVGGDEQTAHTLFSLALEGFTHMDIHRARGDCMFRLGVVWIARGDRVQARSFWEQARVMFQRSSQEEDVWRCDERLANISI
jgi:predicted negative regulator of RcsB-dependent stress response